MRDKFIFFHNPSEENGYLSNWYLCDFVVDGIEFSSMEQYMMYEKAKIFEDYFAMDRIISTKDVREIKEIGREVNNYNDLIWNGYRQIVVFKGLLHKFKQNNDLNIKLLDTNESIIAECAVKDLVWGIGFSLNDEQRFDMEKWKGKNLLGFSLMVVRDELKKNG